MKGLRILLGFVVVTFLFLIIPEYAKSQPPTCEFFMNNRCDNNGPPVDNNQLELEVRSGSEAGTVNFKIINNDGGSVQSSITRVYIDDGDFLTGIDSIVTDGTNFAPGPVTPASMPDQGNCTPPFNTTLPPTELRAGSSGNPNNNGITPGKMIEINYDLAGGVSVQDVCDALGVCDLKVGYRLQAVGDDDFSQEYIQDCEPPPPTGCCFCPTEANGCTPGLTETECASISCSVTPIFEAGGTCGEGQCTSATTGCCLCSTNNQCTDGENESGCDTLCADSFTFVAGGTCSGTPACAPEPVGCCLCNDNSADQCLPDQTESDCSSACAGEGGVRAFEPSGTCGEECVPPECQTPVCDVLGVVEENLTLCLRIDVQSNLGLGSISLPILNNIDEPCTFDPTPPGLGFPPDIDPPFRDDVIITCCKDQLGQSSTVEAQACVAESVVGNRCCNSCDPPFGDEDSGFQPSSGCSLAIEGGSTGSFFGFGATVLLLFTPLAIRLIRRRFYNKKK